MGLPLRKASLLTHGLPGMDIKPVKRVFDNEYSQKIRLWRMILPLVSILMISTVVFWGKIEEMIMFSEPKGAGELPVVPSSLKIKNVLIEPSIVSTDEKGNPYKITAKTATQEKSQEAFLENPQGEIFLEQKHIEFSSQNGVFNERKHTIRYLNGVELKGDGYTVKTEAAAVNLKTKIVTGDKPVHVYNDKTDIKASQGFTLDEAGNKIIFRGKTRMILMPADGENASSAAHQGRDG